MSNYEIISLTIQGITTFLIAVFVPIFLKIKLDIALIRERMSQHRTRLDRHASWLQSLSSVVRKRGGDMGDLPSEEP